MKTTLSPLLLSLTLALSGAAAQAAGTPYLGVAIYPGTPGYTVTYNGEAYPGNTRYNPDPDHVLKASWANQQGTSGLMAAELGRLRVAEFGAGRATAADGSMFGLGGSLREARFEDRFFISGAGLDDNTVVRIAYQLHGSAGGRIETNVDQGGVGRLDVNAELAMIVGSRGVSVKEHTWATHDVLAGGQQRNTLAHSDLFDVTATGFSMRLGPALFGNREFDLSWRLSVSAQCLFSFATVHPSQPQPVGGCSYSADYGNTASFMGISLYDGATGALLDPATYDVRSASGFDYAQGFAAPPVPEPQTWALMALGLGLLGWRARSKRECPLG
ncbi:PEP-CTERM sorting domain-containing protein [Roseateles asaccharophilus]|uniref:Ice-binding protein C-terminal domain-containing protein n=1 Tax=Roseateles asaccharophilus TaxID=582607 RepID=A0ABU2A6H8_9BURK|nr:PEP-CTERM sorting domain-containing protein [Roseateles asaccharophilus]MDR7332801.1 hypothetical protein [Roseateles asaccharophilus]